MKIIKVAISQRIIPQYRVPFFKELAKKQNIQLTVFYGDGFNIGTEVNANEIKGFNNQKLYTIKVPFKINGTKRLVVFHPGLIISLIKGNYDVIITEPVTNILNVIFIFLYVKLFRKKIIWHEAGGVNKSSRKILRKVIDPLVKLFIKNTDAFLTYNTYANVYLSNNYKVYHEKIFLALNSIDTTGIKKDLIKYSNDNNDDSLTKSKDYKVALFIGALEKRKRVENLIKACGIINKQQNYCIKCWVIGDGPDINYIKSICTNDELDNTVFFGRKVDDLVKYILFADVVVLPGQGGLSINHALACGKPIIATEEAYSPNTISVYDYIKNGFNGYVADINNIDDLASKISLVLYDEMHYKSLCTGAFTKAEEISIEKMVDSFEKSIQYVLNI
jgi:glycosyltransferase involved in cell wall biosynthesis